MTREALSWNPGIKVFENEMLYGIAFPMHTTTILFNAINALFNAEGWRLVIDEKDEVSHCIT